LSYRIGIIYDKPSIEVIDNIETNYTDNQKKVTKDAIYDILKKKYEVVKILVDEKIVERLVESKIDLAFNLSTGTKGESRQSQIPAILEMLGISYVGSGILAHSLALDKSKAKEIFAYHNVSTPAFQTFNTLAEQLNSHLNFPLIAKPACEGSGYGIHKDSVVYNKKELEKKVKDLLQNYHPPVLVEEFIEGREFTVGIIGNGKDKIILPIMEIDFDDIPEEHGKFNTFEVKTKFEDLTKFICPAQIDVELERAIKDEVSRAFDVLGCRDISRVDIRVKNNKPYILEINSLPGLKPGYSDLTKMALVSGLTYEDLIFMIVDNAMKRSK